MAANLSLRDKNFPSVFFGEMKTIKRSAVSTNVRCHHKIRSNDPPPGGAHTKETKFNLSPFFLKWLLCLSALFCQDKITHRPKCYRRFHRQDAHIIYCLLIVYTARPKSAQRRKVQEKTDWETKNWLQFWQLGKHTAALFINFEENREKHFLFGQVLKIKCVFFGKTGCLWE